MLTLIWADGIQPYLHYYIYTGLLALLDRMQSSTGTFVILYIWYSDYVFFVLYVSKRNQLESPAESGMIIIIENDHRIREIMQYRN